MQPLAPLDPEEIQKTLAGLPGWTWSREALERCFTFADFSAALGFIVRVGLAAERLDHHPEIHHVYARVVLRLNTHAAGDKVTMRDVALARAIQDLAPGG
ncbi:MAG: 4a-hydroxytetrahydrobiopterin dehydratase [Opitutaceae bacterium]|nr:4a-hydroxytetrahydrobiopterin dehydratase [Opitutaceae bacterium]